MIVFSILPLNQVQSQCDHFTDLMMYKNDTIANKLQGGKHYYALNPTEDLEFIINRRKNPTQNVSLIAILAKWCGYCKQLKQSGMLTKLSKDYDVYVLTDDHPQTPALMKLVESQGFPTLIVLNHRDNKMYKYTQARDYKTVKAVLDKYKKHK